MSVRRTNRFWLVSLKNTLFLDFLKLFVNMRLAVSFTGKKMHFWDLRIKSYGCLKFQGEIWAGWACARANQQELTTCAKSGGQEENKFQEKWEQPDRRRRRPTVGGRPEVTRRPRVNTCACQAVIIFLIYIYIFFKRIFGSLGNGLGLLGEWVYNTPII
jgi:hypothetical protein